jgi:hypothetical protein
MKRGLMRELDIDVIEGKINEVECGKVGKKTTVCVITLDSGFEIIGTSSCLDADKYNQEVGDDLAYNDAMNKLIELEAYHIAESNFEETNQDELVDCDESVDSGQDWMCDMCEESQDYDEDEDCDSKCCANGCGCCFECDCDTDLEDDEDTEVYSECECFDCEDKTDCANCNCEDSRCPNTDCPENEDYGYDDETFEDDECECDSKSYYQTPIKTCDVCGCEVFPDANSCKFDDLIKAIRNIDPEMKTEQMSSILRMIFFGNQG